MEEVLESFKVRRRACRAGRSGILTAPVSSPRGRLVAHAARAPCRRREHEAAAHPPQWRTRVDRRTTGARASRSRALAAANGRAAQCAAVDSQTRACATPPSSSDCAPGVRHGRERADLGRGAHGHHEGARRPALRRRDRRANTRMRRVRSVSCARRVRSSCCLSLPRVCAARGAMAPRARPPSPREGSGSARARRSSNLASASERARAQPRDAMTRTATTETTRRDTRAEEQWEQSREEGSLFFLRAPSLLSAMPPWNRAFDHVPAPRLRAPCLRRSASGSATPGMPGPLLCSPPRPPSPPGTATGTSTTRSSSKCSCRSERRAGQAAAAGGGGSSATAE